VYDLEERLEISFLLFHFGVRITPYLSRRVPMRLPLLQSTNYSQTKVPEDVVQRRALAGEIYFSV
jgi:hypothetical protein